jgi:flavin-dependent dehydrogenase
MYDAIIVGARCAGASLAMLLARKGHRVLLLDRATFPSDTISGHFILHEGTRKLAEWDLLDTLLASGCPPINRISTDFGDGALAADLPTPGGVPLGIGPRRTVLDKILVDAAVAAGAELREAFVVTGLLTDGDRVTGITGHTNGGPIISERARIAVGADGKHSSIARFVQASLYLEQPSLTCWYYTYWSDFPAEGLEINWRHQRIVFSFLTNDGLTMIAAGWPHAEFHYVRSDIEANYLETLRMIPSLAERLPDARRAERFAGMADVPNFFRKPYGPGWALVGDAGHHKDPTPAHGISDALHDAALLATALDDALSGQQDMSQSLARYHRLRDERAIPLYREAVAQAHLEAWDKPDAIALRAAVRHNPADASLFYAATMGVIPKDRFFNPNNLQHIIERPTTQLDHAYASTT